MCKINNTYVYIFSLITDVNSVNFYNFLHSVQNKIYSYNVTYS